MGDSQTPFERLLAQQRTDKDRQQLHSIRDLYGLKGSDAMWSIVMLFQNYLTAMERIPEKIDEAARGATEAARTTAEAQTRAAQANMAHAATKAIERVAIGSARKIAAAQLLKWISGAVVLSCIVMAMMFRYGASSGRDAGANDARARCEQDTAAAEWVRSPEGQVAYALAKAGNIRNLAACDRPGWEVKGDDCMVREDRGTTYGWRLPPGHAPEKSGAERVTTKAKHSGRHARGREAW